VRALQHFLQSEEPLLRALRAGLIAALFWMGGHVAVLLLRLVARRRGAQVTPRSTLGLSLGPLRALLVVLGLYYATAELELTGRIDRFVNGALYLCAIGVASFAGTRLLTFLAGAFAARLPDAERARVEREYLPLASKVGGLVVAAIAVSIAFHHFGIEVTALITTLGVGGLAVGLAARETLSNMIAGLTILLDRPFRPGQRIKLPSGETGEVVEIGIRTTRIRLLDHNLLVVPNADLTNSRIVNYNYPTTAGQATIELRVAFGTDVERVERLLREILAADGAVLSDPKPTVALRRFAEGALEILVELWVEQYADAIATGDRLRRAIARRFEAERIVMPPPQREVRVLERR